MRRPHDVFTQRKNVVKKRLAQEVAERTRVCPKNCKFNQLAMLDGNGMRVSLCLYGQHQPDDGAPLDVSKIIVCNTNKQAQECNARIPRFKDAEEVKALMMEEFKDIKIKLKKYPEIVALDWVLDESLHKLKENPPSAWKRLLLWVAKHLEDWAR